MNRTALIGWLMTSLAGCSLAAEDEPAPAGLSPATESRSLGIFGHTFELAPRTVAPGTWLDAVEVCTNGGTLCTTADRGIFFLEGVQPHSRFEVTFSKAGYVSVFAQVDVDKYDGFAEASLLSVATAQSLAEAAGAPTPRETGGVIVQMMQPGYGVVEPLEGASFAVRGTSVQSVYIDEHGAADAARGATSPAGWGAALGIAPGTIEIDAKYELSNRRCGVWSSEVSDVVNPGMLEVRAGQLTVATMICLLEGSRRN